MAIKIIIVKSLYQEIEKKFKRDSIKVFDLIESLKQNPKKGKLVSNVGGIAIKELKYKGFRFYFLADSYKLKFISKNSLIDLLFKFVRMSDKKQQAKVIAEIKEVLLYLKLP